LESTDDAEVERESATDGELATDAEAGLEPTTDAEIEQIPAADGESDADVEAGGDPTEDVEGEPNGDVEDAVLTRGQAAEAGMAVDGEGEGELDMNVDTLSLGGAFTDAIDQPPEDTRNETRDAEESADESFVDRLLVAPDQLALKSYTNLPDEEPEDVPDIPIIDLDAGGGED
jgi:hypothetical protein